MEQINLIIKSNLPKMDMTSQCENLPELTESERQSAIQSAMVIKASRLGIQVETIQLKQEEIDRVLLFARQRKLSYQKTNDYWKKVDKEEVEKSLTPEELKKVFLKNASLIAGKPFIIDMHNEAILNKLFLYFSSSPDAETHGISLNKGVMLMGGLGTGKSTIMRAFEVNQHHSFRFLPCMHVTYDFVEHGFSIIKDHSKIETMAKNRYWQTERGICYDDLGTEEERRRYGDKVNAMTEIILNRYDQIPHYMTHITTNLNALDIETIYGARIRSRMREMFNIFSFEKSAPDRRK